MTSSHRSNCSGLKRSVPYGSVAGKALGAPGTKPIWGSVVRAIWRHDTPAWAVQSLRTWAVAAATPTFPPAGFLGRVDACRIVGVALRTWSTWDAQRRVPCGTLRSKPGNNAKVKLYAVDDLKRFKAELDAQAAEAEQKLRPYVDPACPAVVHVPIATNRPGGMEALIDLVDLPGVGGKQWNWSPGKPGTGTAGGTIVLRMMGTPKLSLARIVLGLDDANALVSHRNGDRLDCRRENLMVRTREQVSQGRKKQLSKAGRAASSRFKGVSQTDSGRKWAATIAIGGKVRQLGRFRSEIDAALAYDAAARELFGEDARVNLPDAETIERLRAAEPVTKDDATWPPPGMIDRYEASARFGVSLTTWLVWERKEKITCGQHSRLPNDQPGRCKLYPIDALEQAREIIEQLGKPYRDPDRPGCVRVPLRSHIAHREMLIDADDMPIVEGKHWNWAVRGEGERTEGAVVLATLGRQEPLHRLIMGVTDPRTRVRFLNGDALDCRRANLGIRSPAELCRSNRKMGTVNGRVYTSRFKGVSWDAPRERWNVQIRKEGVSKNVGRFYDELHAAEAYDAAARELFGEHARLNFPGGVDAWLEQNQRVNGSNDERLAA